MLKVSSIITLKNLLSEDGVVEQLEVDARRLSKVILDSWKSKKLVLIYGNGGSAADAQHLAGELQCYFERKNRQSMPAIALTANSSTITAWANDESYDGVFERQVEGFQHCLATSIGLSTSGMSKNVLNGLYKTKKLGGTTVLVTGKNKADYDFVDYQLNMPSQSTALVQTLTQVVYHRACEIIESELP